jgi:hypothetical protein
MACDCYKCEFLANPNRYDVPLASEWEPLYRAEKRRADAAEAAVARVRALHHTGSGLGLRVDYCRECDLDWPCPTVETLDAP